MSDCAPDPRIEEMIRLQLEMMKGTGLGRRGQHYKQHGCVSAKFEVPSDIPDRYKVGLFKTPAVYDAHIRFSNGSQLDDTQPDIHGMAIKLMGVAGQKILKSEASAPTHDFILADNPVFLIRDTDEYVRFMRNMVESAPRPPLKFILWLALHHPLDVPVLLKFRRHRQDSPLAAQYWSQVPYAFGAGDGTICRYSVVPHADNMAAAIPPGQRDAEYLRRAMVDQLTTSGRPARFDFCLQLRENATAEVIDTPTVTWDTPVQRVAAITIPPQTFDTAAQMEFGENLSYTPWHALPEHRPVGQINEIRKAIYLASSKERHQTNHVPPQPPGM